MNPTHTTSISERERIMKRNSATPRTVKGVVAGWIGAGALVAVAALGLGVAPGLDARASATVTPVHPASHGPTNAKPVKKTVHKSASVAKAQVKIANFKFGPRTLTVKLGTKVTWVNKDAIGHSVNFASGHIDSKTLDQNAKFSHTFTAPGTYPYICDIHPFMHGTVVVTA
jgi:amicyanin